MECDGDPSLVNDYLHKYGLSLAVVAGLVLDMQVHTQADFNGAPAGVMSQGVAIWPHHEAERALCHGECEMIWLGHRGCHKFG